MKFDPLTKPLVVRDDTVQIRIARIGNGFLVKAGPDNQTFFEDIHSVNLALRDAINRAFYPEDDHQ